MSTQNWTSEQYREYMTKRLRDEARARERIINEAISCVGAVPDTERQRDNRQAVGNSVSDEKGREKRLVYRVHIISVRSRLLDGDNLTTGAKFLRDSIAETLGLSDAEGSGIEWEYSQCLTRGEQGTLVTIEQV